MLPTQRSLELLRRSGWRVCVVEQKVHIPGKGPFVKVTRDAFGFGDLLAIREGIPGAFMVQVTVRSHTNDHITKVMDDTMETRKGERVPNKIRDNLIVWLRAGNRFEIYGWFKKKEVWTYRRTIFDYHGNHTLAWRDEEPEL